MNVQGDGKNVKMLIGDKAIEASTDTAVQTVIKAAGQTAGNVIEGGGTIITAPAIWLKDIQQNWLTYMIVAAIILLCISFLYCSVCSYLNQKKDNGSNNNLLELAKVFSNKNGILQQPLALSATNLPSIPPNLVV
ncbi:unnamed protein product [Rotaria sp. Silwood2]|nr:unnamed protein product [Rotaria sp. Silwood2]CAF3317625.1 unnamed protein product [Rotaria sp. Silwood2]CAF4111194.1 unnamed protein product [Rotaria sp. Silwood2]